MCIAVLTTPGKSVPLDVLNRCFEGNPHGAGFAYIKHGKVVIDKGFMEKTEFIKKYTSLIDSEFHKENPMLIHCRIATMGKVHPDNCHPFRVRDGALIHNGSLFWDYGGKELPKSDTRLFAERLHNVLNFEDISIDKTGIEKEIQRGNKIAMLFNGGKYIILNENGGVWKDGIWYSHRGPLRELTGYENWRGGRDV